MRKFIKKGEVIFMDELEIQETNKVYARPDTSWRVEKIFSSVFEQSIWGDILIEEGNEDHHAHPHLKYECYDDYGRHNYKIVKGKLVKIPDSEKTPIPNQPQVSPIEKIQADLTYVAMMGDVEL